MSIISAISGEAPFSSKTVPNMVAWYKGDKGVVTSGSNVTAWNDQSGNNNHLAPYAAVYNQYYSSVAGLNGKAAVYGDAVGNQTLLKDITDYAQVTTFCVYLPVAFASLQIIWNLYGSNDYQLALNFSSADDTVIYVSGSGTNTLIDPYSNVKTLVSHKHSSGATSYAALNNDNFVSIGVPNINVTHIDLFGGFNGAYPFKGYIAEFIMYSAILSDPDIKKVKGYLNKKFKLY